jgi:hypothetical protein
MPEVSADLMISDRQGVESISVRSAAAFGSIVVSSTNSSSAQRATAAMMMTTTAGTVRRIGRNIPAIATTRNASRSEPSCSIDMNVGLARPAVGVARLFIPRSCRER